MENEQHVYYVSRTHGGDFNPSAFNVTQLHESFVVTLLDNQNLARDLGRNNEVFSIEFWDYAPNFAADKWRQAEGEEDPRCVLNNDVRLSDVIEGEEERAFLTDIPPSLERALVYDGMYGGINIRMEICHRKVYAASSVYWRGIPKHTDVYIETCGIFRKDLVRLRDWLATARQIEENK